MNKDKKKKKQPPVTKKASRNDLIRKNQELYGENVQLKRNAKASTENYKLLILVSARLLELHPDDEIFTGNILHKSFMEVLEEQVKGKKEAFDKNLKESIGEAEEVASK